MGSLDGPDWGRHGGVGNSPRRMKATYQLAAVVVLLGGELFGQGTTNASGGGASAATPWAFNLVMDGYIVPNDQSYVSPTFTADRKWLHLEARYNDLKLAASINGVCDTTGVCCFPVVNRIDQAVRAATS